MGPPAQPRSGRALPWCSGGGGCAAQQRSQERWRSHGGKSPSTAGQTHSMAAEVLDSRPPARIPQRWGSHTVSLIQEALLGKSLQRQFHPKQMFQICC